MKPYSKGVDKFEVWRKDQEETRNIRYLNDEMIYFKPQTRFHLDKGDKDE